VDSSVGGKTGINIPEGKNLVGSFYQPEGVFADTAVLSTLEERDWYSGVAEAVKMAVTLDRGFFEEIREAGDLSPGGDLDAARVVAESCRIKAWVVEQDELESDLRKVLNFGHTMAHALEVSLGYGKIRHGEAVVLGMRAALYLSRERCGLADDSYHQAMELLDRIPVPVVAFAEDLAGHMTRDKKALGGKVQAVLISDIGKYHFEALEDTSELVTALGLAMGS
jgi:3-dehydroquinate synthase